MVTIMTSSHERIIESMIALARCSTSQRIIVAGSKSVEITHEMTRRGFEHVAASANCGKAAAQYDVALIDWRRRTLKDLEPMLDWLVGFLGPEGVVVVWMDPQKAVVRQHLCSMLERRGFVVGEAAIHDYGSAVSGKRYVAKPLPKAA
jgi:hypothetical protein